MGETMNAYIILWRNLSKMPQRRWNNNIKMDLRETACKDGRWIE